MPGARGQLLCPPGPHRAQEVEMPGSSKATLQPLPHGWHPGTKPVPRLQTGGWLSRCVPSRTSPPPTPGGARSRETRDSLPGETSSPEKSPGH